MVWTLALSPKGYARFNPVRGKTVQAHRYVYEQLVGPIPNGLEIDHLCRNRGCLNPKHLEPVTRAVNQARGLHGILFAPPKMCKKGLHDLTQPGAYIWRKGCVECRRVTMKKANDEGNARRRAQQKAIDPGFGTHERRSEAIKAFWRRRKEKLASQAAHDA